MIIDGLPSLAAPIVSDEMPIERGTTTYKAQVGDILAGGALARPNLLDNWYFVGGGSQGGWGKFPINQRGQTSYSIPAARTKCIDIWFSYDGQGSGSIQIVSGGVKITKTSGSDGIYFGHFIEQNLNGKTVTASVLTDDGRLFTGTGTAGSGPIISAYPTLQMGTSIESGKTLAQIYVYASTLTIVAAKLELGVGQTLAHQENGTWVLNEVPDFSEQLTKCQRYLFALAGGTVRYAPTQITSNLIDFTIPLPVSMRNAPTNSFTLIQPSSIKVYFNGTVQTGFTFSGVYLDTNAFCLRASKSAHGGTGSDVIILDLGSATDKTFVSSEI